MSTTSDFASLFVRFDYDEPPPATITTAVSYDVIVPDDDIPADFLEAMAEVDRGELLDGEWDAEDAALIESRRNSPRLAWWWVKLRVLYLPRWLIHLCFQIKRKWRALKW